MKPIHVNFSFCLILLLLSGYLLNAQPFLEGKKAEKFYQIQDNFKHQIDNSLPKAVVVQVKKPRKLLIYSFIGTGHPSIPYANYAFHQMGELTGAFEAYFSNDTTVFQPEYLNQFDALILNNTSGILFEDPSTRQALLDYVYEGHGIIGIHAGAGATFVKYPVYDQFPAFGQMMGGYENGGHPWHTWEWINWKINEPDHVINQGFKVEDFDISDEIYQYLNLYDQNKVRVLISVNTDKTDMEDRKLLPARRLDLDFPISWIKEYGRGRVFNSASGHHPHINWDSRILDHYLRGFQFALGDLDAATTPTGRLNAATIAQEKTGLKLGIEAYTYKDETFFDVIDHATSLDIWNVGGLNVQKVSSDLNKNFDPDLTNEEMLMVRNKLIEAGVSLKTYYFHDIPNNELSCKKIFEFGKKMGIETFISEPKPEALDLIGRYCEDYNIRLAIHNHGPNLSPLSHDPAKLMKALKGKSLMIGACGDTGYWTRNGFDPMEAINILGDRLFTIQLHDLDQLTNEGHDVPWGTGKSKIKQILEAISAKNLTMTGLEYSFNWGQSDTEIERSKTFFDQINIDIASNLGQ